jgi:Transposase
MKRTKYTTEFKLEAVKQILDKGHSAVEVSSRLGGQWVCCIPGPKNSRGQMRNQ